MSDALNENRYRRFSMCVCVGGVWLKLRKEWWWWWAAVVLFIFDSFDTGAPLNISPQIPPSTPIHSCCCIHSPSTLNPFVVRCYPCHLGKGWLVGRGGFLIADCDVCSPLNPPQPDGLSLFLSVNPIRRRRNGGIKRWRKSKKILSRPTTFVVRYLSSGREISLWCLVCVCVCHNSGGRSRRLWRATIIELFQTW
jgi:hypothetical protein